MTVVTFIVDYCLSGLAGLAAFGIGCAVEGKLSAKGAVAAVLTFCCGEVFQSRMEVNEISTQIRGIATQIEAREVVTGIQDPILKRAAENAFNECAMATKNAREGCANLNGVGSIMDVYHDIFQSTKTGDGLFATSMLNTKRVWGSQLGNDAFDSNKQAIARGARIKRIFILKSEKELSAIEGELQKHHDAGVEVYWALEEHIPPLNRKDFVVTSGGRALQFLPDSAGGTDKGYYEARKEESGKYRELWKAIHATANAWPAK